VETTVAVLILATTAIAGTATKLRARNREPSPKNGAEGAERVRSRGDRWRQLDGNVSDYLTPPPGRAAVVVLELVD
jgi:hypothetical protein